MRAWRELVLGTVWICVAAKADSASASPAAQCSPTSGARLVSSHDIPVAHTPPGGYRDKFPKPVLAACSEPLVKGAPDLRGVWRTLHAEQAEDSSSRALSIIRFLFWKTLGFERTRTKVPAGDRIYAYVERIEQCGDRIVDMGGGTIADARADGSEEHAVHDVSAFDFETPITAVASYANGVFLLKPPSIPIEITRRLDAAGHMLWHRPDLGDRVVTLERIGGPCDTPPGTASERFRQ